MGAAELLARVYQSPQEQFDRRMGQITGLVDKMTQQIHTQNMQRAGSEMIQLLSQKGSQALDAKAIQEVSKKYNLQPEQLVTTLKMLQGFKEFLMPSETRYINPPPPGQSLLREDQSGKLYPAYTSPDAPLSPTEERTRLQNQITETAINNPQAFGVGPEEIKKFGGLYVSPEPFPPTLEGLVPGSSEPGVFQLTRQGGEIGARQIPGIKPKPPEPQYDMQTLIGTEDPTATQRVSIPKGTNYVPPKGFALSTSAKEKDWKKVATDYAQELLTSGANFFPEGNELLKAGEWIDEIRRTQKDIDPYSAAQQAVDIIHGEGVTSATRVPQSLQPGGGAPAPEDVLGEEALKYLRERKLRRRLRSGGGE